MNLNEIMGELATERPMFHSEADFQHAMAWKIHEKWPRCSMRLEYVPQNLDKGIYLDIWSTDEDNTLALELKYKTKSLIAVHSGEGFKLKNHSALDFGRYDFIRDIQRLEDVVGAHDNAVGYAIMVTNDYGYWNDSGPTDANDAEFRVHEGRQLLPNSYGWKDPQKPSITKEKQCAMDIKGSYEFRWKDYSQIEGETDGLFKYLLVKVDE